VVVFLSWAAELQHKRSLPAPPPTPRGEKRLERAQGLPEGQGDHSTRSVTGKAGSAQPVPVQPGACSCGGSPQAAASSRPQPPPPPGAPPPTGGQQRGDLLHVGPMGCRGTACSTRGLSTGHRGTAAVCLEHLLPSFRDLGVCMSVSHSLLSQLLLHSIFFPCFLNPLSQRSTSIAPWLSSGQQQVPFGASWSWL